VGLVGLAPGRAHGIAVRTLTRVPGQGLCQLAKAPKPSAGVACSGIAAFEHVKQEQAAGRCVQCLEVEGQHVWAPAERPARRWLPGDDGAGRIVGVRIAAEGDRAAQPRLDADLWRGEPVRELSQIRDGRPEVVKGMGVHALKAHCRPVVDVEKAAEVGGEVHQVSFFAGGAATCAPGRGGALVSSRRESASRLAFQSARYGPSQASSSASGVASMA
jgi:hypothetical protein